MGTDIHGWLEVGRDLDDDGVVEFWKAAVNLGTILRRSYGLFGSFFGVRNYANFDPVAADRGLPVHRSRTVKQTHPDGEDTHEYHDYTWLGYDEDIDWQETPRLDRHDVFGWPSWNRATRTHKYTTDGELVEQNVVLVDDGDLVISDDQFEHLKRRRFVEVGDYRYESYPITRYDAAFGNWRPVVRWARYFQAEHFYEPEEIRLVAWFGS